MHVQSWGGGAYCEEYQNGLPPAAETCLVPYNATIYQSEPGNAGIVPTQYELTNGTTYMNGTCYAPAIIPYCGSKDHVQLPFGAPEYVGLGFLVFVILVFLEIFGSPFMRNAGTAHQPGPAVNSGSHCAGSGTAAELNNSKCMRSRHPQPVTS